MGERVGAQQMRRRARGERRERIVAGHAPVAEPVRTVRAEHQRPVDIRPHQDEPDVGMHAQRRDQLGVALADLLERQPPRQLHQVDEAEVARAEDDDVAAGHVGLRGLLAARLARCGLVDGLPDGVGVLVARVDPADVARRQRSGDQLVEPVAVALAERRPLRLAVV